VSKQPRGRYVVVDDDGNFLSRHATENEAKVEALRVGGSWMPSVTISPGTTITIEATGESFTVPSTPEPSAPADAEASPPPA
jgi:hypothetical protein